MIHLAVLALWLGSPPPPRLDPSIPPESVVEAGPIEGPARPPAWEDGPEPSPDSEHPGIEFAPTTEPTTELDEQAELDHDGHESDGDRDRGPAPAPGADEVPTWPDPGTAPNDGLGMIAAGLITMPSAALMTRLLVGPVPLGPGDPRVGTIAVGAGMGAIGLALLGTGLARHAKLRRWAVAYRVRPQPQGAGLLVTGGIATSFGVSLIATGIIFMGPPKDDPTTGAVFMGIGAALVAGVAPPTLIIGQRRRARYQRSGGWTRPSYVGLEWRPRVLISRDGVGFGVAGRF